MGLVQVSAQLGLGIPGNCDERNIDDSGCCAGSTDAVTGSNVERI